MDFIANLSLGFSVAATPENLLLCFVGVIVGTAVGVLPGVGPVASIAILLPVTFGLTPVGALIMLAGIYYGAQYGGSTTSILVNIPGEASSVVTTLDGFQMAQQGRAGPALAIAAIGSFIAGTVGTLLVALLGDPLTKIALMFGAAEFFALMMVGLVLAIVLASGSVLKAIAMVFLGLVLSTVGSDLQTGVSRLSFGIMELSEGVNFVVVAMGVFGITEILRNVQSPEKRGIVSGRISHLIPTRKDLRQSAGAIGRGTVIGSILGVLPGGGAVMSSFAAYTFEKRISREPERFGKGAIEGVAAPESANNAAAQTAFIPLLTLGIPGNAVMALFLGAMTMQGIVPGPQVMTMQPSLVWAVIASMWLGNVMLVILNLPLIGIWVSMLRVPYRLLFPAILIFCCIGAYAVNNSSLDTVLMGAFGLAGYWLLRHDFEPAPLILALVLGPLLEENLRRAVVISNGDPSIFVTRPLSAALLFVAAVLLVISVIPAIRKRRQQVFAE